MIDLIDVSIQFTGVPLFSSTNIKINKGDRIALVGANGTGKSTILKMLAGLEETSSGRIIMQKNISVGYLPQEYLNISPNSVFDEVKLSLSKVQEIENKEVKLHSVIDNPNASEAEKEHAINEMGELEHNKAEIDFYAINSQIEKVLEGLGFTTVDFTQPVSNYSGGWQMRIELAKILLGNHDIILLDEPTNHLDLDSLQWLISFLMNYKGALLLVSHDRFFVNRLTARTLEIFNRTLTLFNGNYDAYLRFKDERDKQLIANFQNQEKKKKQTEQFIDRFRYKSTKAKQVQSRIKQLNKLEDIELPDFESKINLRFPEPPRSGSIPIDIKTLTKKYDKNIVFDNFDFRLERGDKIAFVGPNGAGKTTLAKIIAGKINYEGGDVLLGHNTITSYYAQEVAEDLDLDSDVIDSVMQSSIESTPQQIRTILGSFLFTNDDVFKKVGVLSGGEKSRVALAKILLTKANLIILDEPTNHLDYNSKLVLQDALVNFKGSLVIVSHDVDFLKPIVNKVLEIRKLRATLFVGGIDYYLSKRNSILEQEELNQNIKSESNSVTRKDQKRFDAENRKKKHAATKILKKEVAKLEKEIENLELLIEELEVLLGDEKIYSNPQLSAEKNKEYENAKNKLEIVYSEWTERSEVLENIESDFN